MADSAGYEPSGLWTPDNLNRWTRPDCYIGASWPEYFGSGVGRSRDSDCLEESNFAAMLELLGGESGTVLVISENHWAVGWVEWIAIHESDEKALRSASEAVSALENYPVLDETDFSEREHEAAATVWRDCFDRDERVRYVRDHPNQFEPQSFADLLGCIRGEYFIGYASELLH